MLSLLTVVHCSCATWEHHALAFVQHVPALVLVLALVQSLELSHVPNLALVHVLTLVLAAEELLNILYFS